MAKFLVGLILMMPLCLSAATLNIQGLSKEQIAELNSRAEKMRSPEDQVQGISAAARAETAAWANLGANIGTAMVSAARELGLAANEFSQTGLGKIVTGVVIYKVMGRDILGVIVGTGILIFGYGIVVWLFVAHRFGQCKYEYHPVLWGMFQRRKLVEYTVSDNAVFYRSWLVVAVAAATTVVGLSTIF